MYFLLLHSTAGKAGAELCCNVTRAMLWHKCIEAMALSAIIVEGVAICVIPTSVGFSIKTFF